MRAVTLLREDASGPSALTMDLADEVPPLTRVRGWARRVLSDLTDDEVDDCLLVVTELVANAYDHGEAPRRVRLDLSSRPCSVRVEVDDATHGEVVVGTSRLGEHRGRGMVLVAYLSAAWSVEFHERGKTVWAEVSCSAPPSAGG
ncbi:anti-sigma regulatory factor (Ser/Thr protein kinase) [Saccharothrix carnea]|uniref:Anti-sigma regulatory factor (Ser/Thr protein kinase) n=1 Tax=Saccharothrix carnea TaxID=1280637 RepID=A0A2P8HZA6_SACCR|nr:ATP-binding protein [Saccharothrix carnea]PSL51556.1 anti-sigma regulatory factor (Ser/Thr protein kinase) [Saccharothrix carnea]